MLYYFSLPPKSYKLFGGIFMERKVKYDYTFTLECVKLVVEKHFSWDLVSAQKGLSKSNICKWVGIYIEQKAIGFIGSYVLNVDDYNPEQTLEFFAAFFQLILIEILIFCLKTNR